MCDADDIIRRLKEIIRQSESGACDARKCCDDGASISSSGASRRDRCPKAKYCDLHYTTPAPSVRFDLPDCPKYEVRCKQTLDGNVAKPTIVCGEDSEQRTFYPPMYFDGGKFGGSQSYRPIVMSGRSADTRQSLQSNLDQMECACKNGFCPPSRYDQFMAGKGGLPVGHPDNGRPEKFHYTFGMGVNNPAAK